MDIRTDAGNERSGIDNFVDAAFAFAITLLIINGSIPHSIDSLQTSLKGVPAFAAAFAQLAAFWYGHVRWRDDVGICDRRSTQLSLLLVFFALIFIYPLHMVFASFLYFISAGFLPVDFTINGMHDMKVLFVVYGATYACMAGTLCWLFRHGLHAHPDLPRAKRIDLAVNSAFWGFAASVGLVSALIAIAIPDDGPGWLLTIAGFAYAMLSFTGLLLSRYRRRLERQLQD